METHPEDDDDGMGVNKVIKKKKTKLSDLDLSFKIFTKIFLSLGEIIFSLRK